MPRAGSWKSLVMTRSTTAIVMADNRAPASTSSAPTYPALAFALNALYACGHGYDLLYYRMASPTCAHPLQGARDASYCKMPAIAAALQAGYDSVAFVDSDSFFLQRLAAVARRAVRAAAAARRRRAAGRAGRVRPAAARRAAERRLPPVAARGRGGSSISGGTSTPGSSTASTTTSSTRCSGRCGTWPTRRR